MSEYIGNDKYFNQPEVNQYGSHMVMTNVMLPSKGKYLNMDTRHGKQVGKGANYNMVMPDRVDRVKSMKLTSAEIPITYYNISSALNNNVFGIVVRNRMNIIKIPDGNYAVADLISKINETIKSVLNNVLFISSDDDVTLSYDANTRKVTFNNADTDDDLKIVFNVTQDCVVDTKDTKFKLGYLLGFRESSYDLPKNNGTDDGTFTSEAFCNVSTPRYLYLVIDEFSNGNPSSFVTMLQDSQVSKSQILAKITIDQESYDTNVSKFGSIYFADEGAIISDTRVYTGPINLQRMNVQLVNEQGLIMNLNNMDFSFCLELTHE